MTKADTIFKENITKIMEEGVWSEQARPKYKDGTTANSIIQNYLLLKTTPVIYGYILQKENCFIIIVR